MQTITMKRALSFLLAFALAFSMLPIPAFASETEISEQSLEADAAEVTETVTEDEVTKTTETTVSTAEPATAPQPVASYSDTMNQVQAAMDGILNYYLGTAELTAEEAAAMVAGLSPYDAAAAEGEIYDLENAEAFLQLTEKEIQKLIDDNAAFCAFGDAVSYKASTEGAISVYTTVEVLDGQLSIADTANSNKLSNGVVTITAAGSIMSKKTNTITITNNSGSKATLKFDYSASTYNSFTIAGTAASASGTYSITLDNGGALTLVLVSNSGLSNRTATLTLSNFSLELVADSANVTFSHNNLGSITLGGAAVTSGSTVTIESAGAAAVATPVSGATFLGWLSTTDNKILSTSASATLVPTADLTSVEAVFVNSSSAPFFRVNTEFMYDNLTDAVACAATRPEGKKNVILANSGTLATGDYTITSGVTLLIPFDAADTLYTNAPAHDNHATWVQPTAFRTLTMAQNATITVASGASISLSAKHHAGATGGPASKANGGSPTGAVSFIKMNTGSKITVQGGGNLYAWGYITGSGSVEVQSSGTVYENFQLNDFRGGTHTYWATDPDNVKKAFPINSYYVQNIEVPVTLYAGASEICYSSLYASTAASTSANFIASSGAMFNLTDGYLTKKYDGTTDRLVLDFYGTGSLSPLSLSLGGYKIESSGYNLPINSNITVNIHSGKVSIEQSLALLPGAVVTIDNGAEVSVSKGKNIYVYDSDQWLAKYLYPSTARFHPLAYAPGRTYNRTDADLKDAAVLVNGTLTATEGAIYTTSPGYANIYSTGTGVVNLVAGTETETHQVTKLAYRGSGWEALITYDGTVEAISITPAQLKNADGTYEATAGAASATTYVYVNGKWQQPKQLEIKATNIAVGSGLDMHFYVDSADMMEGATYTAVVTKKFADNRANSVKTIPSADWGTEKTTDESGNPVTYREFIFEDISAKEMTDPIDVKIYLNDSTGKATNLQVNATFTETVQTYAIRTFSKIAGKMDEENKLLKTALADMLYYGAAAQEYFNYNNTPSTLATTSSATGFQAYLDCKTATAREIASYLNVTEANPEEKLFVGNTVSATNTLMFTFYFGLPKRDGYSAIITYTDHNGKAQTREIDGPDFYERTGGSLYGVDVLGMSIIDGRSKITCKLYECDLETAKAGSVDPIATVVDSVEGYARRMNSNAIFVEMMEFVDSASEYFDYKNNPTSTS